VSDLPTHAHRSPAGALPHTTRTTDPAQGAGTPGPAESVTAPWQCPRCPCDRGCPYDTGWDYDLDA
jgi:hypothetical protein